LAATSDTARRPRTGAGRPDVRRRVRRQCGGRRRRRGSLIPHAGAIRALVIAMIEAPLGTAPMARPGRTDRGVPPGLAAGGATVHMAPITGGTDRKRAVAPSAGLQAQGGIHHVGARGPDWTTTRKRGTTGVTGSDVGARVGHEGPEYQSGLSPSPVASAYPKPPVDAARPVDAPTRPRGRWNAAPRRPTAPTGHHHASLLQKDPDKTIRSRRVQNHALSRARPQRD